MRVFAGRWRILLTACAAGFGSVLLLLETLSRAGAQPPAPTPAWHVAIWANSAAEISSVTAPFVASGDLAFLRDYAAAGVQLNEGNYPVSPTLQVFEVTTDTLAAPAVVTDVINAATAAGLGASDDPLRWLSYSPTQVVVSGTCADLSAVMSVPPIAAGVTETDRIDLTFAATPSPCGTDEELRLYSITDTHRVADKVALINNIALAMSLTVNAEPNFLIVGAPEYISGSPAGPHAPNAPAPRLSSTSTLSSTGARVRVVLFDTVPYAITEAAGVSETHLVNGVPVTAWAPLAVNDDPKLPGGSPPLTENHGTFVASPVTHLAPDADIHLVRVLNDAGYGNAWTLYKAMALFITDTLAISSTLDGAVFNYSFVLEGPADPEVVVAMTKILSATAEVGIVQVAAAGNDSAYTDEPQPMPLPASHPAVIGVTAVTHDGQHACFANLGEISALGGGLPRGSGKCDTKVIVNRCADGSNRAACVVGWDPLLVGELPPPQLTDYDWGLGTSFAAPVVTGLAAQCIELIAAGNSTGECQAAGAQGVKPSEAQLVRPPHWPDPALVRDRLFALADNASDPNLGVGILPSPYLPTDYRIYVPVIYR